MGILDNVMNVFGLNNNNEYDYDDYEDDDFDDELEEEKPSIRKKLFSGKKYDEDSEDIQDQKIPDKSSKSYNKKIVPIKTSHSRGMEVVVVRPKSMDETKEITDTLLSGKAVVLNLEGLHIELAQRIIDYSAGSCYAMGGNLQKVANYIYLVTPPNVDISGDIPDIVAGGIDLSSFKNDVKF